MLVVVTGGTGFLGRPLVAHLARAGHTCVVLTRDPHRATPVAGAKLRGWNEPLPAADAIIHLAGESIIGLWTARKRRAILQSRLETTRRLVAAMETAPPKAFLVASAVGYYGHRPGEVLTEDSAPDPRGGFRSAVCRAWEAEANEAARFGVRVVNLRIGNVLDPAGGYLRTVRALYQWGLSFIPGDPDAMVSWIGLKDTTRLISFALEESAMAGPVNVTAPNAITQRELARAVAKKTGRRVWGSIPPALLRWTLGEFASAVLDSQNVIPAKAQRHGFHFTERVFE